MGNLNYYGINLQITYSVDTIAQRDAIPTDPGYRSIGDTCYVKATNTVYQLSGGVSNANWVTSPSSSQASTSVYSPNDLSNWNTLAPSNVSDALNELSSREIRETIGSIGWPGIWYPNEGIGCTYEQASAAFLLPIQTIGFYRVVRKGVFRKFGWTNSIPPGSQIDAQIWVCPNANPNIPSFTGISLSMLAGAYLSTNDVDTLNVNVDDMIFIYNSTPSIGYTGGQIIFTAQFIPKN